MDLKSTSGISTEGDTEQTAELYLAKPCKVVISWTPVYTEMSPYEFLDS